MIHSLQDDGDSESEGYHHTYEHSPPHPINTDQQCLRQSSTEETRTPTSAVITEKTNGVIVQKSASDGKNSTCDGIHSAGEHRKQQVSSQQESSLQNGDSDLDIENTAVVLGTLDSVANGRVGTSENT